MTQMAAHGRNPDSEQRKSDWRHPVCQHVALQYGQTGGPDSEHVGPTPADHH